MVHHSCIHHQSIGRFRDETAEPWAVDSWNVGPARHGEAAVFVGLPVAERKVLLMRCGIPSREEHNLVVEAWEAVQIAHRSVFGVALEEEIEGIDGEAQVLAGGLVATRPALVRHSRCHRTCCLAALWDKLAVGEIACAGLTGGFVEAGKIVAGTVVADSAVVVGKVVGVGVRASGGDSSPARGRQECHSRRTNIRRLQGRQKGEKSNPSFMQVAEAEKQMC